MIIDVKINQDPIYIRNKAKFKAEKKFSKRLYNIQQLRNSK
ncbi:hypothetical protein ACSW9O_15380 (plasmid) [Clostridium perfringens]